MNVRTWKPHPLHTVIIELLQRKGPATDMDLLSMIKEIYSDLSFNIYNKALMRLEIEGLVHVSALTKGKRRVELLKTAESGGK
jgi:Fe2+ or Zn2+ uptake regulation protein